MRSLLGCEDAITVLGMWECDRYFRDVGNAIAFGMWECDRCLRMWGCDRFWGVGVRSLFWDIGNAIAVLGMWGCDSEALRRNRLFGDVGVRSRNCR